jgi:glycerophosphoryl diester phosphodiesterase
MTMQIYAHRGYSSAFPENTMSAFQGALDLGVYGVELDIHASADGIPVVIHDESLDRTTNGSGLVTDKTAAELAALDAGNGQGVPTFEAVIALANGRFHVDIEIKGKHCERAVLDVLARHPNTKAAISSFDWDVLENVHELAPNFELWVLTDTVSDEAMQAAQSLGATTLAVDYLAITKSSMANARDAGFEVMAWTVNTQKAADRLRKLGVFAICTDDPYSIK